MLRPGPEPTPSGASRRLRDEMLRFGLVGVVGFVVNAGLVEAFAAFIGPAWAQAIAFPAAVTTTWWLNRRYTFAASRYHWRHEWLRYAGANMLGWIANNGVYFLLILNVAFIWRHASIAVAAGSLAGMVFNFAASKWLVFR